MDLFAGTWGAVGVFLLLIEICMPNFAKRKRQIALREEAKRDACNVEDLRKLHDLREWVHGVTNQSAETSLSLADELAKLVALHDAVTLTD